MESSETARKLDIVLASEYLRNRLHCDHPSLIKDRRYHLRIYQTCFVGRELVDWLIDHLEASNRILAVKCMNMLQEYALIHHVCDDHQFKDQMLFYRFFRDDGTGVFDSETEIIFMGLDLYYRILSDQKQHLLVDVQSNGNTFKTCFVGRCFVDWLILNGEVQVREKGVEIGSTLLRCGLVRQLPTGNIFEDDDHYYQFTIEHRANQMKLMDLLNNNEESNNITNNTTAARGSSSPTRQDRGLFSDVAKLNLDKTKDITRHRQFSYESPPNTLPSLGPTSPRSVIIRQVSVEELEDKRNPYVMTKISVSRDAVGYGFVVRGNMPVYVQTVDPSGPAAEAGIKVRQYIFSVNGKNVLRWNHGQVAEEILNSPRVIELVVMNHFRGS